MIMDLIKINLVIFIFSVLTGMFYGKDESRLCKFVYLSSGLISTLSFFAMPILIIINILQ